jgi:hypothetical protein
MRGLLYVIESRQQGASSRKKSETPDVVSYMATPPGTTLQNLLPDHMPAC